MEREPSTQSYNLIPKYMPRHVLEHKHNTHVCIHTRTQTEIEMIKKTEKYREIMLMQQVI